MPRVCLVFTSLTATLPDNFESPGRVITPSQLDSLGPLVSDQARHVRSAPLKELRVWLREPEFRQELRQPLTLDRRQLELATTRTESGYRRIRGAAGSGKSLILAARAAELARTGKTVLVVSYNITLLNYLRNLAARWPSPDLPFTDIYRNVVWVNFHEWCRRICAAGPYEPDWGRIDWKKGDEVFDTTVPALASKALRHRECQERAKYDAILVDEGQDFNLEWWSLLREAVRPGGEMLLVADRTQDIYNKASAWTEATMEGAGFRGGWVTLDTSYRLSAKGVELAREFAQQFLPAEATTLPQLPAQRTLGLVDVVEWEQVASAGSLPETLKVMTLRQLSRLDDLAIPELVVVTPSIDVGEALVTQLRKLNIAVQHTFDDKSRELKLDFSTTSARVKVTTIHSFKGWETRALVLHIGTSKSQRSMALAYAGLTRVRGSDRGSILSVVCECDRLARFGNKLGATRQ